MKDTLSNHNRSHLTAPSIPNGRSYDRSRSICGQGTSQQGKKWAASARYYLHCITTLVAINH